MARRTLNPRKQRKCAWSDDEWDTISLAAEVMDLQPAVYIREVALDAARKDLSVNPQR